MLRSVFSRLSIARHNRRTIHTLLNTPTSRLNSVAVTTVIEDRAFLVPQFLSTDECKRIIVASEKLGYSEALVNLGKGTYSSNEVMKKNIRNNDRLLHNNPTLATMLYARLNTFPAFMSVPEGLSPHSLNSNFRFYRYVPGQRFKQHADGIVSLLGGKIQSRYTMLMFLNEDMKGGETRFLDGAVSVRPQVGQALFFWHKLMHEGMEVTHGTKYILRTDVLFSVPICVMT